MACRVVLLAFFVTATCSSWALGILYPRMMPFYPPMLDENLGDLPEEIREIILKQPDVLDPRLVYMREKCAQVFGGDPERFALPSQPEEERQGQGDATEKHQDDGFSTRPTSAWDDPAAFARYLRDFQHGCVLLKGERPLKMHEDDTELSHLHDLYTSSFGAQMKIHEDLIWAELEKLHAQRVKQILQRFDSL